MSSVYERMFAGGTTSRREVLRTMAALGIVPITKLSVTNANAAEPLNIFTLSVYAQQKLYPDYADAASLNFSIFGEPNEAVEKLRSGFRPDLIGPAAWVIPRLVESANVRAIETSRIDNWGKIFPEILDFKDLKVDGKYYGVPWAWSPVSVMYRTDLAKKYVGAESWKILWDEEYAGRLGQRDSGEISAVQALLVMGEKDPYQTAAGRMGEIRDMLKKQKELLRFYWQSETDAAQAIVSGEVVATYAWPSTYQIAKRAGAPVAFMKPKEGTLFAVDTFVILNDTKVSDDQIYEFLNAALGSKTAQALLSEVGLCSANKAAFDAIDSKTREELGYEDPDALLANAVALASFSSEDRKAILGMFEEVKAGL